MFTAEPDMTRFDAIVGDGDWGHPFGSGTKVNFGTRIISVHRISPEVDSNARGVRPNWTRPVIAESRLVYG